MKRIIIPAEIADRKTWMIQFLEYNDITWAQRETEHSFSIITKLSPELETQLMALLTAIFPGAQLIEAPDPVRQQEPKVEHEETWYQFRSRMASVTRITITLDILDNVLGYQEKDGVWLVAIERVSYVETRTRYRVTETKYEINTIQKDDAGRWQRETVSFDKDEQAPDSIKFGDVLTAADQWERANRQKYIPPSELESRIYVEKLGKLVK